MNSEAAPTNIQGWLRTYSNALANSFHASGLIEHTVTKGESREHQILDVLSKLLPTRLAVEPNVVIVDSTDVQSPKFDGALVDRMLWPRIFADGNTIVVMIESVLAAIEVKSLLDRVVDAKLVLDYEPNTDSIPVLYTAKEDTLLVYLNFLSEWVTAGTTAGGAYSRYSQALISKLSSFYFGPDFLFAINSNENQLLADRKHFERKAKDDIEVLYTAARKTIGLS